MATQSEPDAGFNETHSPTRPGKIAYIAAAGILVLFSFFFFTQ